MKNWRIKVLTGPSSGKFLPVEPGVTLGRSRARFNLQDPKASSIHAVIKKTGSGKLVLVDNDSRNGTKVNGQKRKKIILMPGVTFQIGSTKCEVIDFQKYIQNRASESEVSRYGGTGVSVSFEKDFSAEELNFGSTDSNDVAETELEPNSPIDKAGSTPDVNVLGDEDSLQAKSSPFYQGQQDISKKISAAPKLNIKKFEDKHTRSQVKPPESGAVDLPSQLADSPFAALENEVRNTESNVDFANDKPTNPSYKDPVEPNPENNCDSLELQDSPEKSTASPAEELESTMVLEVAKHSVAKDDPFGALAQEISDKSDVKVDSTAHGPGEDSQNILATVAEESPAADIHTEKTTPLAKADTDWADAVLNAIDSAEEVAENKLTATLPLVPGIRLIFTQGPQINTAWTIGYGPREIGPESSEFPLVESGLPDICFSLHPTERGVMFKTSHPDRVSLNNKATKSDILSSGDVIRIGESMIEVETF